MSVSVPIFSVVVLVSVSVPMSSVVVLVSVSVPMSTVVVLVSVLSVEPSDMFIGYQNPRPSSKQTSSTPGMLVTVYVIMNTWTSLPTSIWCPR